MLSLSKGYTLVNGLRVTLSLSTCERSMRKSPTEAYYDSELKKVIRGQSKDQRPCKGRDCPAQFIPRIISQ